MLSQVQIAEQQRSDAHPLEALHRAAERCQHAAHLALAPLDQHHAHQAAAVRTLAHDTGAHCPCRPVFEHDATAQALQQWLVELLRTGHHHVVLLFDPEPRVGKAKRQLAVVGQQNQALGVDIEPADRVQPPSGVHQLDDSPPAFGVVGGAHHTERLVQRQVLVRGLAARDRPPIDLDTITGGIDLRSQLDDDGAVDPYPVVADHPFGGAARGHARVGEDLVQPLPHPK